MTLNIKKISLRKKFWTTQHNAVLCQYMFSSTLTGRSRSYCQEITPTSFSFFFFNYFHFAKAFLIRQLNGSKCKSRFKAAWGGRHLIYIKTQQPCFSWDKGPDEPCEICMCGGSKDPPHGKINSTGAFAYNLCSRCEGGMYTKRGCV